MNAGISRSVGTVSQASVGLRSLFIAKVYGLLFAGLAMTVGVGYAIVQAGIMPPMGLLFIASIICVVGLSFARRVSGLNLLLFFVFTALEGAILGPFLAQLSITRPGLATQAAMLTLSVFGSLSAYVFISKKDFSFLGGMLFVGLIGLLVSGIVMMIFNVSAMATVYSLFGIVIFSGFVLYDTSQIINRLSPDDVVTGAIELYLDMLNLFLFILRLLNSRN